MKYPLYLCNSSLQWGRCSRWVWPQCNTTSIMARISHAESE